MPGTSRPYHLYALGVIAVLSVAFLLLLPVRSIWINDEGNKLLAAFAFADGGRGIPNGAAKIDPSLSSFPPPYFVRMGDGRYVSGYGDVFPALSSIPLKIGGLLCARVLPLLAGLLCALAAAWLAAELGFSRARQALAACATFLCTPLLFYSFALLEISTAACLSAFAALFALKSFDAAATARGYRLLFVAGLLGGAAALFREEAYPLLAAFAIALPLCGRGWRDCGVFVAGAFIAISPLWLHNLHYYGSLFGLHAMIYDSLGQGRTLFERLERMPDNLFFFVLKPHGYSAFTHLGVCALAAGMAVAGVLKDRRFKVAAFAFLLVASAGSFVAQRMDAAPFESTLEIQSIFDSFPLAFLALLILRDAFLGSSKTRFLLLSTLLCAVEVALLLDSSKAGIFWGARHFTILSAQLAVLAVAAFSCASETRRVRLAFAATALLLAALIQFDGLQLLWRKKAHSEELLAIAKPGRVVVTDVFWLPEEFAALQRDSTIVFLRGPDDIGPLLKSGVDFVFLRSPCFSPLSGELLKAAFAKGYAVETGAFHSRPEMRLLDVREIFLSPKR